MIRFYYAQSPDEGGELVEFTDRVNLDDSNVKVTTQAEQSSVGSCTLTIDDPNGDWAMSGHRKVLIYEDLAPFHNNLVWWGYTADQDITRGDETPVLSARQWQVHLTDINTLVQRKVMAGNDTDRPAETDVERIQWLLTTGEAGLFQDITTFVSTASPVNMDAADYNGQMFSAVIDDCLQQSMKNSYMRWIWDDDTNGYVNAFWYGHDAEELALSGLRISNVLADIDDVTTWEPALDSVLNRDPSRVFSGIFGNYDGGFTYRSLASTIADFANRDTIASWPNVKTLGTAQARGDRQLQTLNTQEEVITTFIEVPPENVNDAHHGDLISVRYSHFPGFEGFRDCRILLRTVTFVTPRKYRIDYVLTPLRPIPGDVLIAFFYNNPAEGEPSDGSDNPWTKAFYTGDYATALQFPGPGGPSAMGMWYRAVVPGEGANVLQFTNGAGHVAGAWVFQVSGASLVGAQEAHGIEVSPCYEGADPITPWLASSPSAAVDSVWFAMSQMQKVSYGQFTIMDTTVGTEVVNADGSNLTPSPGVNDLAPPHVMAGYVQGTGVLDYTIEGHVSYFYWTGATPNYGYMGRGWGGLLMELDGTFGIGQMAFDSANGADVTVTLPSPP